MNYGEVVETSYLFGEVRHSQAGELEVIKIFGFSVFQRIGSISILFGISWVGRTVG